MIETDDALTALRAEFPDVEFSARPFSDSSTMVRFKRPDWEGYFSQPLENDLVQDRDVLLDFFRSQMPKYEQAMGKSQGRVEAEEA